MASDVRIAEGRQPRLASFCLGFALGFVVNLAVIAGLVYLKQRDTSANPWETLALGTAGAAVCISPAHLLMSGLLTGIQKIRWLSSGLFAAGVLGLVTLVSLYLWSSAQADRFALLHHLA